MEEKELLAMRHKYYSSFGFLRNLNEVMRSKYLAFSQKVIIKMEEKSIMNRYNRAHHSEEFFKVYNQFKFQFIPTLRLYYCLANVSNRLPVLPWQGELRKLKKKEIDDNFDDYITGFDWGIDFDIPNDDKAKNRIYTDKKALAKFNKLSEDERLEKMKDNVLLICLELDKRKVPYYVKFSGSRGFHIRIPYMYLQKFSYKEISLSCSNFCKYFDPFGELWIDTFANDKMKLWKLDYSVDKDKVALPLTIPQLKNFTYDFARLDRVMSKIQLVDPVSKKPRGLCMVNAESFDVACVSAHKFIEEFLELE